MTDFETKDSGKREEYVSGMRRDIQAGKPRFDLTLVDGMPYGEQFLTRFAALLGRGAEKYGEKNWQLANSAEELARFKASALRHITQWATGEVDEDHAAAVAFNLMAYEATLWKLKNSHKKGPDNDVEEDPAEELEDSGSGDPCQCVWHRIIRQEGDSATARMPSGRGA